MAARRIPLPEPVSCRGASVLERGRSPSFLPAGGTIPALALTESRHAAQTFEAGRRNAGPVNAVPARPLRLVVGFALAAVLSVRADARELAARLATAVATEQIVAAHAPNVVDLLKKADRYGQPFSAQFSAMFPLFGPRVFRSAQMRSLDMAWPVDFYLVAPRDSPVRFAYTAGATDPQAFLAGLGKAGPVQDGVASYLAPGGATFFGASLGSEVLVSDRRELALAALHATPAVDRLVRPEGDLELDLSPAPLLSIYAVRIDLAEADFFQRLESLHNEPGISPKEMRTFYAVDFLLAEALCRQVGRFALSFELDGPDGVLRARVEALPGTSLSRFLAAQTGLPDVSIVHVPRDAVAAMGLSFVATPELVGALVALLDPNVELGAPPAEAPPADTEDVLPGPEATPTVPVGAELRRHYQAFYGALGPSASVVVLPALAGQAGVRSVTVFDYREPDQFVPRLQGLVLEVLPFLVSFYRDLGWTFDMWLSASLPAEMPEGTWQLETRFAGMSDEQRHILEAMYGGPKMRVYLRPVGRRVVAVTGPDAGALMREWSGRLEGAAASGAGVAPSGPGAGVAASGPGAAAKSGSRAAASGARAAASGAAASGPGAGVAASGPGSAAKSGPSAAPGGGERLALGFVDVPAYLRMAQDLLPAGQPVLERALMAALGERQQLIIQVRRDGSGVRLELRYPLEAALRVDKSSRP